MRRAAVSLVLLTALLTPGVARAVDPPALLPIPSGEDVILVVHAGDKAPITGQLFDQPTALRWANYIQQYRARYALDLEYQSKVCAADAELARTKLELQQKTYDAVTKDLQAKLVKAQADAADTPWYRSVGFGVGVGVVGTVAIIAASAALVNAATK